jgi:outer membrane protein assembly factor BamD (BamD/ComL family)
VLWTPTVLILDSNGIERERNEGYLPNLEFRARLEMGLARIAFMHKQWAEAERRYDEVAERYSKTTAAPEAIYWRGVSRYKATNDHAVLSKIADELNQKYQESVWTLKSLIWSH